MALLIELKIKGIKHLPTGSLGGSILNGYPFTLIINTSWQSAQPRESSTTVFTNVTFFGKGRGKEPMVQEYGIPPVKADTKGYV